MLSRFRKRPKLTDQDATARRQALAQLSQPDAEDLQHLERMAQTDDDTGLRTLAIGWLSNDAVLGGLLEDAEEPVAQTSASRIATLLADGASSRHAGHPLVMRTQLAAGVLPDPALLSTADPRMLADCALASTGDTRQTLLASEAFGQAAVLTQLEKRSRARDKSLNRFAREQLERIRQLRTRCEQQTNRMEELLTALEKHLDSNPDTPAYADKQLTLTRQAESLVDALSATAEDLARHGEHPAQLNTLRQRFDALPQVEVVAATVAASATTTAVEPAAGMDRDPATNPFEELVLAFNKLDDTMNAAHDFEVLSEQRQMLTNRWLAAADLKPPLDAQHRVFEAVSHRFRLLADAHARLIEGGLPALPTGTLATELPANPRQAEEFWHQVESHRRWLHDARRALQQLQWPDRTPPPLTVEQLGERMSTTQAALSDIRTAADTAREQFEEMISRLAVSIDEGASKTAQQRLSQARTLLRRLPRNAAAELTPMLNHQAARVSELKDWQTYVTTPKRESLCATMGTLAKQPLHPPDQAQRIKELRAQWNELGAISQSADRALAATFNQLAEQAFEPCREYFAELASLRASNLAAREGICQQVEAYLNSTDWDHTDIKAAETILRTAREEWRRYHPVDRKPGKPLEDRFEALQTQLHKQLRLRWESNLEAKKTIVEAARALLEDAVPMVEKINGAKSLQQRWRAVGPTPRKPDQTLWRQFRAACDEIFNARETAQAAADEAIRDNLATAEKLLADFAELLDTETPSAARLRRFGEQFRNLPSLPERHHRALDKRFAELERDCHTRLRAEANAARLDELRALAATDADNSDAPPEVSLEDLQRMTVEAEIAAGLESTPDDNQLRLSIQVDLMNAGLGKRAFDVDPLELANQWCALGPKPAGADVLRERFFQALLTLARH